MRRTRKVIDFFINKQNNEIFLDMPIARVLVQIVYMKDCNTPGYNLMQLRDLLIKFYGYPTERWNENEFFKELLDEYFSMRFRVSLFISM